MNREQSLEHLSLRLTHLADGIDSELDGFLDGIRRALRDGADARHLEDLSGRLARHLVSSIGMDIDTGPGIAGGYDLSGLRKLIQSMPVAPDAQQKISDLVQQAADGHSPLQRQRALSSVLATAAESLQDMARRERGNAGVLGWLGRKAADDDQERYVTLFATLLQRLVEHIDVLNGNALRSHEIREALQQVLHPDQAEALLAEVTEEIERIDARVRAERSQTTDFLGDLRDRLDGFEDMVDLFAGESQRSLQRSEDLKAHVDEDARSLGGAAEAGSVEDLRRRLSDGLARITDRLAGHVVAERRQFEQSRERVVELRERLAKMEVEADVLRSELRHKNDLALKDALTGAYNRAGYEERTHELYARWKRSGAPLSLVFVDCNRFKQINDNFGHAAGDMVLMKVADVLHDRARASDIVCRYGGDEFVILLPDTPIQGAEVFARSACQEVIDAGFNDNGRPIDVSIACGVTEFVDGDTLDGVFGRADEAMYEAKAMCGICVAVRA